LFGVQLSENTFNAVPISVAFVSEIEVVAAAGVVQGFRTIGEKHRVVSWCFLYNLQKNEFAFLVRETKK